VIYAGIIVKPGQEFPALVVLPEGRKMEKREFVYYRNTIRYMVQNDRSYDIYWKALEPMLAEVKTLYFSPDGIYNKVNVVTLYDQRKNEYIADHLDVRLTSNLKDLVDKSQPVNPTTTATLIGFPDYLLNDVEGQNQLKNSKDKTSVSYTLVRGGIATLPGTKKEVEKISQLLKEQQWKVSSHLSVEATEEIVKAQQNPALLHIATHGFFIDQKTNDNDISFSQNNSLSEKNPLLRSGLLLAGAEKNLISQVVGRTRETSKEDGVLTAYEAMNLNLHNTNLVVLSSCETGAGEVRNGEGVYGLQRSFLVAGANSLMMSLWKIDDEITQELMRSFYQNFLKSKNKRESLRLAQLELKKNHPEPFHWGAFVMIGK
jgi:CHAT domain-containing protein